MFIVVNVRVDFYISALSFFGLKILELFGSDPDYGFCQPWIRDLGWEKIGSRIWDKHLGSATLVY
jgi:hypothetical protein